MRRLILLLVAALVGLPLGARAQVPLVQLLAGQPSAKQYATGLVPWLMPQVLFTNYVSATKASGGTLDSVSIPAGTLNSNLHNLSIYAGGSTTNSSASTKSVKITVANGTGGQVTVDSVKITASAALEWAMNCQLSVRNTAAGGPQVVTCTGLSQSATPTVNLIGLDTTTLDPRDSIIWIRVIDSDSTTASVKIDNFLGITTP